MSGIRGSLIVLACFVTGVIIGRTGWLTDFVKDTALSSYSLYLLMLLVGVGIGSDSRSLSALRRMNLKILLIPMATIFGTALGVLAVSFVVSGITPAELMAVGAGYGYYSLSSILITEMHSDWLGVVALLSNIIRELSTLVLAPLYAAYFGRIAPICSGGATSMDSTLPIIIHASGKEYSLPSLVHGIILTVLVPFIVTFFLSL